MKTTLLLLIALSFIIVLSFKLSQFSEFPISPLLDARKSNEFVPPPDSQMFSQGKDGKETFNTFRERIASSKVHGALALRELETFLRFNNASTYINYMEKSCLENITLFKDDISKKGKVVKIPCGLATKSSITIVGKAWDDFAIELRGPNEKDPPILHVNPRIIGDWSGRSVIEINAGDFSKWWGIPQRCEGWKLEPIIDGMFQCESWIEGNTTLFPIKKGYTFDMNLLVGSQGYHIFIDGHHIASSPFRKVFSLKQVAYLSIVGNVELVAINATSLPVPSIDMLEELKTSNITKASIDLFIGISSKSNNFAERMILRTTWMRLSRMKFPQVQTHFFVGLHSDLNVNLQIKMEADYFQDMVVLPILDHYDIQPFKTIVICEHGVSVSALHVMKADDDTFVRVDAILDILNGIKNTTDIYMGHFQYVRAKDLENTKWVVSPEEWPNKEDVFPRYALGGPGYIVSHDIAKFVASQQENVTLRLEDIDMGIWVQEFNKLDRVQYLHKKTFVNTGCIDGYISVHLKSSQEMQCLWDKLENGKAQCC